MKQFFFCLFLFFHLFSVQAQSKFINVQYADTTITYPLFYKSTDSIVAQKLIAYYTFDTSKIAYEKNFFYSKQSGLYKSYFPNGKVMIRSVYMVGNRNGDFSRYDSTGKLIEKIQYKDGKKNGYTINKTERFQGRYKNDKRNGKWEFNVGTPLYQKRFYEEGKLVDKRQILPNPIKKEVKREFMPEEKEFDTLLIPLDSTVKKYKVKYVSRDLISHPSMRKAYHTVKPYNLALVKYVYNGYVNGAYKVYYPNGALYLYANYSGGLLDGEWKEYSPKGALRVKGKYSNGKKNGKWQFGIGTTKYKREIYRNGNLKK